MPPAPDLVLDTSTKPVAACVKEMVELLESRNFI